MSWILDDMDTDNPMYLQYSPPNGLPQESKLVTYMNRTSPAPMVPLNQRMSTLTVETSPTSGRKQVVIREIPSMEITPMPRFRPQSPEFQTSTLANHLPRTPEVHQENVGGTTYFYATNSDSTPGGANVSMGSMEACSNVAVPGPSSAYTAHPHYSGTPTHVAPTTSKTGLAASFHTPSTIRAEIYKRNMLKLVHSDQEDMPKYVDTYIELLPLESSRHSMASSYRGTHEHSGEHFALRRLHSYTPIATKRLEMWKQIDHPNIVKFHEYFLTKAFGDISLILVYNYHPACETLMSKFLSGGSGNNSSDANGAFHDPFSSDPDAPRPYTHKKNAMLRAVASGALLPEAELWSLLVQLTAALRAIHAAGLACRSLDPTKVVMNGCRVRIAWCGVADALHASTNDVPQAQQDDLTALGRLALALACRNIHCDNLNTSMEIITRTYSADLKNLILYVEQMRVL